MKNEDINSDHSGVNFYDEISVDEALVELDGAHSELDAWLEGECKPCVQLISCHYISSQLTLFIVTQDTGGYREALMERLRFRIVS